MLSVLKTTLLLVCPLAAIADHLLYIPDVDPQPFSAINLGVGSDGRTTWKIQPGRPTGTFTDTSRFGFPGTGILVEGATDAVLSATLSAATAQLTAAVSCSIKNGLSVCHEVLAKDGRTKSDITTETVSSMLVQGSSEPVQPTSGSPSAPTDNPQANAGSSPSGSGPQSTNTPKNAATRFQVAGALSAIITLVDIGITIL